MAEKVADGAAKAVAGMKGEVESSILSGGTIMHTSYKLELFTAVHATIFREDGPNGAADAISTFRNR